MSKPVSRAALHFPCTVCAKRRKKMVRSKFEKRHANKSIRREAKFVRHYPYN